jgi:transcriptional regulator with XRE-family HTH domain
MRYWRRSPALARLLPWSPKLIKDERAAPFVTDSKCFESCRNTFSLALNYVKLYAAEGGIKSLNDAGVDNVSSEASLALVGIGARVREARHGRKLTLEKLANASGVSVSMVSLLERGRASPSISTLVAIAGALGLSLADLIVESPSDVNGSVVRVSDQRVIETAQHVVRRLLAEDRKRGVSVVVNEYASNTGSSTIPLSHNGFEYGYILEGVLTVELDGACYLLKEGDMISFDSRRNHKIWNFGAARARSIWINLEQR